MIGMTMRLRGRHLAALGVLFCALASPALAAEPIVSVWYRGSPAGQPRLDDLAAIRALGFTGVTWPIGETVGVPELRRMAEIVGLTVVLRPEPRPAGVGDAVVQDARVDLPVFGRMADSIAARAWRAVARGARVLSFDPGQQEGTGLTRADGQPSAWIAAAVAIARQLSANPTLVDRLRPGPPVTLDAPAPPGVDVVMLDAVASWVIVATNTGAARQKVVAHLLPGVPYALWVSWLDGTDLSMLRTSKGPQWTFEIDGGKALVYITGKVQK
jgi:hypothetical protein